jgi:hypothetical protein
VVYCFDTGLIFDMICPVAVGSDILKAVTHAFALGLCLWVPTEGSCNGFFISPATSVLHTIASVQPDGVEEKGTRYVERLGGSSRIVRATGRIIRSRGVAYASMMILFIRGKVPFLSTLRCGVGGSLGKN